jgi:hypothetical protein
MTDRTKLRELIGSRVSMDQVSRMAMLGVIGQGV